MLQIEYGSKAPSMLRYHKHARIETSTTWGGFYWSLRKKLINLLLNNGMMSCSCLDIKVQKVMEQWRMGSKLKMVTPNHIQHKPVGCNASPLIKKFEQHTNLKSCRCRWWGGWRGWGLWHIRSADPHAPFSSWLGRTGGNSATSRLCATQTSLIPTLQVRLFWQRCPTSPWHRPWLRSLVHCEVESCPWSGLASPLRKKRLRQTHRMSLHLRPINTAIQTSLTRRNHLLKTVKKRELWSPYLMTLPGNRIKQIC